MTVEDYILLIEVGHAVQQELNRRSIEAADLTIQQASVLARIESAGGKATVSRLAMDLGRASHSMSGMITSLEKADLVSRTRAASKDRRQVWVSLSTQGKRRLAAYHRAAPRMVEPLTDAMVSKEESERLVSVIRTLTDHH
jgi:DNA-binding MarR family transcriptional regulator